MKTCPAPQQQQQPMELELDLELVLPQPPPPPPQQQQVGPRVYFPIHRPDSSLPAYAVLQFLGFSTPSPSTPSPSAPSFSSSSSELPSPVSILPSSSSSLLPLSVNSLSLNHLPHLQSPNLFTLPNFAVTHHTGTDTLPMTPQGLHLVWPASIPDGFTPPASPSPSGVSRKGSSSDNSSDSKDSKDRKSISVKPSPMKKAGVAGGSASAGALSPGGKKSTAGSHGRSAVVTGISVSQTERETIVHTHCSNFREVVHQLTGASSEDKDLLPVTLPARLVNRSGDGGCKQENVAKSEIGGARMAELGPRKPTTKLLERRKTMKNLERLSTSCRELPPLVPSPVTPLTSDFEKICLPTTPTPTASQGSTPVALPEDGKIAGVDLGMNPQQAIAEELAIAEKGFFFHSLRPRNSDPTLLHLFPESPVCSPREPL